MQNSINTISVRVMRERILLFLRVDLLLSLKDKEDRLYRRKYHFYCSIVMAPLDHIVKSYQLVHLFIIVVLTNLKKLPHNKHIFLHSDDRVGAFGTTS
jgi:hypothetical protein